MAAKKPMPISATGICAKLYVLCVGAPSMCNVLSWQGFGSDSCCATPALKRQPNAGFSLLELLVVVAIVAIFIGMAVLSVGIAGNDREIEQEAFRLKTLLDLVREEALMQSRDFGVMFSASAYRFYYFDYQQLVWVEPLADRLLVERGFGEQMNLSLSVEDREIVLDEAIEADGIETPEPQVLILSSGEITPFTATLYRDFDGGRVILSAELDGTLEIAKDEFAVP